MQFQEDIASVIGLGANERRPMTVLAFTVGSNFIIRERSSAFAEFAIHFFLKAFSGVSQMLSPPLILPPFSPLLSSHLPSSSPPTT